MALVTLQTIFQDAFPAYEQTPSLARPRPPSRARHHAVPDGGPGGPYASVPRRPRRPYLVQLVSASVLSAMRVSPDRALAGPATRAAAGV